MRVIYEPKGKAREYSALALNLYNGCNHGCKYCYVPVVQDKDRQKFYKEQTARNILGKIEEDCKELQAAGNKERVLLSFMSDPYQKLNNVTRLTRKTLLLFQEYDIPFQILTKAGRRAEADFDLYKVGDAFATTLTFLNAEDSLKYEPEAALPKDRLIALTVAKANRIETWVSFEPVLNPKDVFKWIEITSLFVDLYKVGKLNYSEPPVPIDWKKFANEVVDRLEKAGKPYYIKKDLAVYLERS